MKAVTYAVWTPYAHQAPSQPSFPIGGIELLTSFSPQVRSSCVSTVVEGEVGVYGTLPDLAHSIAYTCLQTQSIVLLK